MSEGQWDNLLYSVILFCYMAESEKSPLYIYEDEHVICTLNPLSATKGHCMVIPKKQISVSTQMDDGLAAHVFNVANKLSSAVFESMGAKGTNILISNGIAAGQKLEQLVVHVIPRYEEDNVNISWESKQLTEEDLVANTKKISGALNIEKFKPVPEVVEEIIEKEVPEESFDEEEKLP